MEISVLEAATLLGRSRRTVRAQLARGELPGRKRGGRWRIERRHLPLTEAQHRALQRKADAVREAVEDVLPSRQARDRGDRSRSVRDLDAFRLGSAILREVRDTSGALPGEEGEQIAVAIEQGLIALAEGASQFDRDAKREALRRSRSHLSEAVCRLFLADEQSSTAGAWATRLEKDVLPALAGFARWSTACASHDGSVAGELARRAALR